MIRRCCFRLQQNPLIDGGFNNEKIPQQPALKVLESMLPIDYFSCCKNVFGAQFMHPVLMGLRMNEMRGLMLAPGHSVEANTKVVAVPLDSVLTNERMMRLSPNLRRPDLTVDKVKEAISIQEMKPLAHALHFGIHFSQMAAELNQTDNEDPIRKQGMNPIIRCTDDENFDTEWVANTYSRQGLDNLQTKSYNELSEMFGQMTHKLKDSLQLEVSLQDLRRHTRVILARTDVLPPSSYFDGHWRIRRIQALWRKFRKQLPPSQTAMVPLMEMLNHSNRPNVGTRVELNCPETNGKHAIVMYSLRRVHGGEELCRHYNFAMARDAALFRYGFLPFEMITVEDYNCYDNHMKYEKQAVVGNEEQSFEALRQKEKQMEQLRSMEDLFQRKPPASSPASGSVSADEKKRIKDLNKAA